MTHLRLLADAQVGLHQTIADRLLDGILHRRARLERLALHSAGAERRRAVRISMNTRTLLVGPQLRFDGPCAVVGLADDHFRMGSAKAPYWGELLACRGWKLCMT